MTFSIRAAAPDDLPRIEEVMRASIAGLGSPFYDDTQIASAVRFIAVADRQLVDDRTYFVVEDGGTIVACGGWSARRKLFTGTDGEAKAEGSLDPARDAARIRAMFVLPNYARRGLGRMILDASESAARRAGFSRCELMATLPGVPLYEACGYVRLEELPLQLPDGVVVPGVRMERSVK